jgi:hypothetical protein
MNMCKSAVSSKHVTAMLINMKAFDGWTKKFIAHVGEQGVNISVKIQGPYADVGSPATAGATLNTGKGMHGAAFGSAAQYGRKQASGAIIVAGEYRQALHQESSVLLCCMTFLLDPLVVLLHWQDLH